MNRLISLVQDEPGQHEAQHRMAMLPNYYRWILELLRPWIGRRILDVGSGIGHAVELLSGYKRLVLADVNPAQCAEMRERFRSLPEVEVVEQDVLDPRILRFGRGAFDTILCLDVLEHLEDDQSALRHFFTLADAGGHVLLKVPAHRSLYGTMDRASGHFRRYRRQDLITLARKTGFVIVSLRAMNRLAVVPWWIKGRVLKRTANFSRTFSPDSLRLMNRVIPYLKLVDCLVPLPFGLSFVVALRKP